MDTNGSGRVIVGASNSLAGYQALRYAVGEARRRGAELIAVRAFRYSYYGAAGQFEGIAHEAAQAELTGALAEALGGLPRDVSIRLLVCEGSAGRVLAQTADRMNDVIVIGGSDPGRVLGLRRGTVARDCSRYACCPVVMIPVPEMARTGSPSRLAHQAAQAAQDLVRQR